MRMGWDVRVEMICEGGGGMCGEVVCAYEVTFTSCSIIAFMSPSILK